jgi:hypothetical protein
MFSAWISAETKLVIDGSSMRSAKARSASMRPRPARTSRSTRDSSSRIKLRPASTHSVMMSRH